MPCDKRSLAAQIAMFLVVSVISSFAQSSGNPVLIYKKKYVMGTVFEIAAYDRSSAHASIAIEKAFEEVVRIDDLLSDYKPNSALSKLNRSAHFHAQKVSPDLYRVIEQAVKFSRVSNGRFDISIAPLVDLWKAALRGEGTPSEAQLQEVRNCVGYEKIELILPDQVNLRSSCMRLDLGAIGKGYAVDRAAEILRSLGVTDALINAGGSTLFAMGSPPGQKAWLVHLRDPSSKIDPQVMLHDESVSTSEQTTASLLGNSAGHIIDPDTGMPLRTNFAVSAVAKTATASDALSTTLLLLGPIEGKALVRDMADVSSVWISDKAQVEMVDGGSQIFLRRGLSTAFSPQ